jgi:hypothetical protein
MTNPNPVYCHLMKWEYIYMMLLVRRQETDYVEDVKAMLYVCSSFFHFPAPTSQFLYSHFLLYNLRQIYLDRPIHCVWELTVLVTNIRQTF